MTSYFLGEIKQGMYVARAYITKSCLSINNKKREQNEVKFINKNKVKTKSIKYSPKSINEHEKNRFYYM